ncbi:MAG: hypothetical protein JXN10_06520 [Clostridia bacterium]|nr:hypothetical protein [Clostridia bacterium]
MKKAIILLAILALLMTLVTGCSKEEEAAEFGWGTLDEGNIYTNEFFEFSIELNPDMTFLSPQEILNANPPYDENGEEMEPIDITEIEDLSAQSVVQFVYGNLYSEEEPGRFNSYINIFSESMQSIGQTMNKENYVKNYIDFSEYLYKDSMIDVYVHPFEKVWISDREFAKGVLEIDYEEYKVIQEMYAITKNNYVLVIMCNYTNDIEKEIFDEMIASIEID